MHVLNKASATTLAVALAAVGFSQAPTVDGSLDSSYGSALATQTINTGFGVAVGPDNGSELDAAYGKITGGTLYLFLAGNVEANYNHLDLFFDTGATGQNTISASTGNLAPFNNLSLSTGFKASSFITINGGLEEGDDSLYVNYSTLSGGTWNDSYLGKTDYSGSNALSGGSNPDNLLVAINDTNNGVQTGAAGSAITNTAALLGVHTGVELGIPLAALGSPTGAISVIADINGGGDSYLSNQFLSGLNNGTANIGSLSGVNLARYGNPSFTVPVPEPAPMAAFGIGLLGLVGLRRRRS